MDNLVSTPMSVQEQSHKNITNKEFQVALKLHKGLITYSHLALIRWPVSIAGSQITCIMIELRNELVLSKAGALVM